MTFDIDANGILNVSANDKASGREQHVTITASTNLNKSDIERMVSEAKKNEAQDVRRKQVVEARNNADAMIYQVEKLTKEKGEAVPASVRGEIEAKVNHLRQLVSGDNLEAIQQGTQDLQQMLQGLQVASGPAGGFPPDDGGVRPRGPQEDGVVEGEFKDM